MGEVDNSKYFTTVRPDVLREIENRGKKTNTVGLNFGWGVTSDTFVIQKDKLKLMQTPSFYNMLLSQIYVKDPDPVPKKKRKKNHPVLIKEWFHEMYEDDADFDEFMLLPSGKTLKSFSIYLKNKL